MHKISKIQNPQADVTEAWAADKRRFHNDRYRELLALGLTEQAAADHARDLARRRFPEPPHFWQDEAHPYLDLN
jgi:hypothetical protein